MPNEQSPIKRLTKMKDDVLEDIAHEFLTNPRFGNALGAALRRAFSTKERMNRDVAIFMGLAGVPSKTDFDRLADRAMGLNKNVLRLEKRIDELVLRVEKLATKGRE
jgi:hypothetical protein